MSGLPSSFYADYKRRARARQMHGNGYGVEDIAVAIYGVADGFTIAVVRDLLRDEQAP